MTTIRNKRAKRIIIHSLILALLLMVVTFAPALADGGPTNPNCWGTVTSQRASTVHDIGEHVSSQSEPRDGLGNVARELYDLGLTGGPHVSDLGSFLASVDGLDATQCP
ncbi:MAG TPA: hypothetical protein VF896_03590 [Anaerolineales bacterium]